MPVEQNDRKGINLFYLLLVVLFGMANLFAYSVFLPSDPVQPKGIMDAPTVVTDKTNVQILASASTSTQSESPMNAPDLAPVQKIASSSTTTVKVVQNSLPQSKSSVQKDRLSPTTPSGLVVRSVSYNQVIISWLPSTDNRGVAGYNVYQDSQLIGTTIKTLQGFIRLTPSTKYTFGISAFDSAGNSSKINNILVTTSAKPAQSSPSSTSPSPTQDSVNQTLVPQPTPPSTPPIPSLCGNGNQDRGEECDDGNTSDNDMCTNKCIAARCMDGIVNYILEQCDDGNEYDNDWCDNQCHNHVPVLAPGATPPAPPPSPSPSPGPNPTPTPSPTPNPTPNPSPSNPVTYTVNVTSAGNYSPTSLTLKTGDSINFIYTLPISGEVITRFTPSTVSSVTIDSERRSRTRSFPTAGTWTFKATDHNGNTGTVIVQ